MAFPKGGIAWNKGKKGLQVPWNKGRTGVYSEEMLKKRSLSVKEKGIFAGENNPNYGKQPSEETRHKIGSANRGKTISPEIRAKLSASRLGEKNSMYGRHRHGSENPNWKGGITPTLVLIRESIKYAEWRQSCLIRDDFTCKKCSTRGGDLNVHHKKPYSILIKESVKSLPLFSPYMAAIYYTPLWDISNGVTLCEKCHRASKHRRIQ